MSKENEQDIEDKKIESLDKIIEDQKGKREVINSFEKNFNKIESFRISEESALDFKRKLIMYLIGFIFLIIIGVGYSFYYFIQVTNNPVDVIKTLEELEAEAIKDPEYILQKNKENKERGEILVFGVDEEIREEDYQKEVEEYQERIKTNKKALPPNRYMIKLSETEKNGHIQSCLAFIKNFNFKSATDLAMEIANKYDCSDDPKFESFIYDFQHISSLRDNSVYDKLGVLSRIEDKTLLVYGFMSLSISDQASFIKDKNSPILPKGVIPQLVSIEEAGIMSDMAINRYFRNIKGFEGFKIVLKFGENFYDVFGAYDKENQLSYIIQVKTNSNDLTTNYSDYVKQY